MSGKRASQVCLEYPARQRAICANELIEVWCVCVGGGSHSFCNKEAVEAKM